MKLVKHDSKRLKKDNAPFVDYYLKWEYQGKTYKVRVQPCFARDYKFFYSVAEDISK